MAQPPVCKGDALFSKTLLTAYCYLLNFKRLPGSFHHKYLKFLHFFVFKKDYHGSSSRLEVSLKKKLACIVTVRSNPSVIPTSNFVAAARARMPVNPGGAAQSAVMTLITVKTRKIATKYGGRKTPVIGSGIAQATLITQPETGNNNKGATFATGHFATVM